MLFVLLIVFLLKSIFHATLKQGDQIWQFFARWVIVGICPLGSFLKFYRRSSNFEATFFQGKRNASILTKMVWATSWASFYKLIWSPCSVVIGNH
jgi:hypothetical protein